jgi:mRNA interferase MazF
MSQPIKIYNRFDVVIVPFPFTDSSIKKRRPALIISESSVFNKQMQMSVMAMITTSTHQPWALDVNISDLSSAGLNNPSIVRMKLFTLDNARIVRQIGRLAQLDEDEVFKSIWKLVGINYPVDGAEGSHCSD